MNLDNKDHDQQFLTLPKARSDFHRFILQSLVLPSLEEEFPPNLYFRICSESPRLFEQTETAIRLKENPTDDPFILEFSTFFGAFSLTTWCGPAELNQIGLTLEFEGSAFVSLWHDTGKTPPVKLTEEFFDGSKDRTHSIFLEGLQEKTGVLYARIETRDPSFVFLGGYYWTLHQPYLQVTLAIVMPTFKREEYVKKNISLLAKKALPTANGQISLLVIDNGQTLDPESVPEGVQILHNLNYGGSGGFARGVLEAMEENRFTHILFCDDDILIEPEAVLRLHSLLGYIDDKTVVGGGMMHLSQKGILQEIGALNQAFNFSLLKHKMDLSLKRSLPQYDLPEPTNYFGWWFFACSINTIVSEGLPMPFFVRADDIEFGKRIAQKKMKMVSLLGIGVWHEEFDRKMSPLLDYYTIRNGLITMWIHEKDVAPIKIVWLIFQRVYSRLIIYQYERANYVLKGLEDALKGPNFLKGLDPASFHSKLAQSQTEVMRQVELTPTMQNKFNSSDPKPFLKKIRSYFSLSTLNGHLLPPMFMLNGKTSSDPGFLLEKLRSHRTEKIFLHPTVLYYEPSLGQGVLCQLNRKKFFALLVTFLKLGLRLLWMNSRMLTEWESCRGELTSKEFWITYLKLNNIEKKD
ncbi:MAG: glycosyltransferase family 2 protein [Leptospirales bacterium]